jgi:hypothetical protein
MRGNLSSGDNDEIRTTNDELNPYDETRNGAAIAAQPFGIRASSFFRHSVLGLCHFSNLRATN